MGTQRVLSSRFFHDTKCDLLVMRYGTFVIDSPPLHPIIPSPSSYYSLPFAQYQMPIAICYSWWSCIHMLNFDTLLSPPIRYGTMTK